MNKEGDKIRVSESECLTQQVMLDYINNKLSPAERNRVEKHLLECDFCSYAMEGLSLMKNDDALNSLDELISERVSAEPIVRKGKLLSMRFKYGIAAAIALLIISGGILYFILSDSGKNEKTISQNIKASDKQTDTIHEPTKPEVKEMNTIVNADTTHFIRHKRIINAGKAPAVQKADNTRIEAAAKNSPEDSSTQAFRLRQGYADAAINKENATTQTAVAQEEMVLESGTPTGEIKGKLIDKESKEPIPFATVTAQRNGAVVGGAQTDMDGRYSIKPLDPGKYDVKVSYIGYTPSEVTGVIANVENSKEVDFAMNKGVQLGQVEVTAYKVPLINKGNAARQSTVTQEEIVNAPKRDVPGPASPPAGVYQQDVGGALSIRGSRSDATQYYIDGVKTRTSQKSAKSKSSAVTPQSPAQKDSSLSIAMKAYNQKQYSTAVQLFDNYLKNYPNDERATFYDGVSNLSIDRAATALSQLELVLGNTQSVFYDDARWYKALALMKLHRNREAKRLLKKIKKSNSKHSDDAAYMLEGF